MKKPSGGLEKIPLNVLRAELPVAIPRHFAPAQRKGDFAVNRGGEGTYVENVYLVFRFFPCPGILT